jgi:hypothetical protein
MEGGDVMNADSRSVTRPPRKRSAWLGVPAFALAIACLATGCARVSVHTVIDPNADFRAYTTSKFLPNGGAPEKPGPGQRRLRFMEDPLYDADVQLAIRADLEAKGFRAVRGEPEPDLLIGYQTIVRNRADVLPPLYGAGWRGRVFVAAPGMVRWYKEGTLVVDVIDARTQETVWRGVGVGAMRDMAPGEGVQASVREILKDFPPK